MNQIRNYRDLQVWQKAMNLVVQCYLAVEQLPKQELYGMVSQIQRSAVSIPANIAEGHGRAKIGDYLHHLSISNGSLMELETHLLIAERLEYLDQSTIAALLEQTSEIGKMLNGLMKSIRKSAI